MGGEQVRAELQRILAEAQASLDAVKLEQRIAGGFDEQTMRAAIAAFGRVHGFLDALEALGVRSLPAGVVAQIGQLNEDAKVVLYVDRRSDPGWL